MALPAKLQNFHRRRNHGLPVPILETILTHGRRFIHRFFKFLDGLQLFESQGNIHHRLAILFQVLDGARQFLHFFF